MEEKDSGYMQIEHESFSNVYHHKKDTKGLALFIIFDTCQQTLDMSTKICQQIEESLSNFSFDSKFINTTNLGNPKSFQEEFVNTLISENYSCLIAFLIGDMAPVEYSDQRLSYILRNDNITVQVISHQEINKMVYDTISSLHKTVPALIFHSFISHNNTAIPPDGFNFDNMFLCYVSNDEGSLPVGTYHHQLISSLYKVLKGLLTNELMLLIELFTKVRDHYYKCLIAKAKKNFNKTITLYAKNTLRRPMVIKQGNVFLKNKKNITKLQEAPPGIFFLFYSSSILGIKWTYMVNLFEKIKKTFKEMYFIIGEDINLRDRKNYSQILEMNKSLAINCKSLFVLVVTSDSYSVGNKIYFDDGTTLEIEEFSQNLANSFPNIPKVIFISQVFEKRNTSLLNISTEYEHMMVVHSIEKELSNSSLIRNFSMEINNEYFAEIHTILRASILNSTQSTRIQIVDGFRKNFYINYHGHIAQLLNTESDEFIRVYNESSMEGIESFKFYRLMVVGPEGVGKTSLLHVLTGQTLDDNEKGTEFLNKYNLLVQKMSNDWDNVEELNTFIQSIEDTIQDLTMKVVADKLLNYQDSPTTQQCAYNILEKHEIQPARRREFTHSKFLKTISSPLLPEKPERLSISESKSKKASTLLPLPSELAKSKEEIDYRSHKKVSSSLDRIQCLRSKTEFFSAWDFGGQNYLYCLHSLFLSPRSVYLLLIDLTIEDLEKEVVPRHREGRQNLRSKPGVPRTYLEVYEFWLNAIYSVSKTALRDSYHSFAKIIFIFSKADEVVNPEEIARQHLETIKSHMYKKNNAFELVHEEDRLFIISCKTNSPYFNSLTELKSTIKRISDQVAFGQPIPIRWLKLANDILRDEQPILDKSRIQYLAECSKCTQHLHHFLRFFHEIGFFFYKEGKVITNIQMFLNIINQILFPTVEEEKGNEMRIKMYKEDIEVCNNEGKLSIQLFDYIINCMEIPTQRESILELLQVYGILIQCKSDDGKNFFYIPYLLNGSLEDLMIGQKPNTLKYVFFMYFPDGFLPTSLYFTLLSKCIRKEERNRLPKLGCDCALLYVRESLFVSFDYSTDRSYIIISFFTINSESIDEEYMNSIIINYLTFLQISIVEIQTLIPCGNLARIMFVCDSCDTLSLLKKGQKPTCSLDTVFSLDPTPKKVFCCNNQRKLLSEFISTKDPIFNQINNVSFDYTQLAQFILNNTAKVMRLLNWRELSSTLYSYGLISIQTLSIILNKDLSLNNLSKELLMEMVLKSASWAIIFLNALQKHSERIEHFQLYKLIEKEAKLSRHDSFNSHIYHMKKYPHGIAFIVNIENFKNDRKRREGSKHDVASLRRMFNFLQYDTRVYEDLTRREYIKAQNYIRALNHSEYDSFFCVIMSHGNEKGEVIFSNEKPLRKDRIVAQFSPKYCEQLKEKPKIFIFQACRGTTGKSIRTQTDGGPADVQLLPDYLKSPTDNVCKDSVSTDEQKSSALCCDFMDTFIGDSTVDQYVAYREPTRGTFFIESFCSVMQSCSDREFTHIMMEVRRDVSHKSNQLIQCTEDTNRLQGPVYF